MCNQWKKETWRSNQSHMSGRTEDEIEIPHLPGEIHATTTVFYRLISAKILENIRNKIMEKVKTCCTRCSDATGGGAAAGGSLTPPLGGVTGAALCWTQPVPAVSNWPATEPGWALQPWWVILRWLLDNVSERLTSRLADLRCLLSRMQNSYVKSYCLSSVHCGLLGKLQNSYFEMTSVIWTVEFLLSWCVSQAKEAELIYTKLIGLDKSKCSRSEFLENVSQIYGFLIKGWYP